MSAEGVLADASLGLVFNPVTSYLLAGEWRFDHSEPVITIVSGIPGAGKTTVSRLLAEQWPRSVHLEGDRIGAAFIVRGLLHPGEEPAEDSEAQLLLRRRNTALLADSFGSAGFEVVIDDVIVWPGGLQLYLDLLGSRPIRFVVLAPRLDVVAGRDAGRDKHVFELWRHLDDDLRRREVVRRASHSLDAARA